MHSYVLSIALLAVCTVYVAKATIWGPDPNDPTRGVLWCEPCSLDSCQDEMNCKGGMLPDACNCCKVCAKVENEVCGGKWYMYGRCDKGLYCDVSGGTWTDPKGVCRKTAP